MRSASCWKNPRERCFPEWRWDFSTASALARALASRFTLVRRKRVSSSSVDFSNCENKLLARTDHRPLNKSFLAERGDKRAAVIPAAVSAFPSRAEQDRRDGPDFRWQDAQRLTNGTARMAVAQPVGTKACEVLIFNDPTAGKKGPIAWQMHKKGLFDEYKDARIEVEPKEDRLIIVE